jgi:hypothetical protein
MSKPTLHRCGYCSAKVLTLGDLPNGWGLLGTAVACRQCIVLARVLA